MMQYTRYIVGALGIVLIIALGFLLQDQFSDVKVLVLDVAVVIAAYIVSIYIFTRFTCNTDSFADNVPGLGVNMYFVVFYIVLAIIGILLGTFVQISFKWQLFYQMVFMVLLASGVLTGQAANQRQNHVVQNSESINKSKEQLLANAQLLKVASLSNVTDNHLREGINKFVERVNYLSPSQSEVARTLEEELLSSITQMQTLVKQGDDAGAIVQELEKANQILKQRIQTY